MHHPRREATMESTHDMLTKPTLLAVDDTADNLTLLNDLLEALGGELVKDA